MLGHFHPEHPIHTKSFLPSFDRSTLFPFLCLLIAGLAIGCISDVIHFAFSHHRHLDPYVWTAVFTTLANVLQGFLLCRFLCPNAQSRYRQKVSLWSATASSGLSAGNRRWSRKNSGKKRSMSSSATMDFELDLSRLSHELNTSLNAILGAAQILAQTDADPYLVATIIYTCKVMSNVVKDFLDLGELQKGCLILTHSHFSITGLLRCLQDMFIGEAHRWDIHFEVSVSQNLPSSMIGDLSRVKQVLVHIIINAFKAVRNSPDLKNVSVLAEPVESRNPEGPATEVRFMVSDNGCGIAAEDQQKLFEPFRPSFTGSANTDVAPGCGLGLCLSDGLVRLMGGCVSVQSEIGVCTIVEIILPLDMRPTTMTASVDSAVVNVAGSSHSPDTVPLYATNMSLEDIRPRLSRSLDYPTPGSGSAAMISTASTLGNTGVGGQGGGGLEWGCGSLHSHSRSALMLGLESSSTERMDLPTAGSGTNTNTQTKNNTSSSSQPFLSLPSPSASAIPAVSSIPSSAHSLERRSILPKNVPGSDCSSLSPQDSESLATTPRAIKLIPRLSQTVYSQLPLGRRASVVIPVPPASFSITTPVTTLDPFTRSRRVSRSEDEMLPLSPITPACPGSVRESGQAGCSSLRARPMIPNPVNVIFQEEEEQQDRKPGSDVASPTLSSPDGGDCLPTTSSTKNIPSPHCLTPKSPSHRQKQHHPTFLPLQLVSAFHFVVVDDSELNCRILQKLLASLLVDEQRITTCNGGLQAVEAIEQIFTNWPNKILVLTDIHMPVMDGLTLAMDLRARGWDEHTMPIIGVTADHTTQLRDQCLRNNLMQTILTKPIVRESLRDVLVAVLTIKPSLPPPSESCPMAGIGTEEESVMMMDDSPPLGHLPGSLPPSPSAREENAAKQQQSHPTVDQL